MDINIYIKIIVIEDVKTYLKSYNSYFINIFINNHILYTFIIYYLVIHFLSLIIHYKINLHLYSNPGIHILILTYKLLIYKY